MRASVGLREGDVFDKLLDHISVASIWFGADLRRLLPAAAILLAGAAALGWWALTLTSATKPLLYSNLDRSEAAKVAQTLRDAGVPYEFLRDGTAIQIGAADAGNSKGLLAERGIPADPGVGYEIMDRLGASGLTSFVQDMTRVRIIEGELARTIRQIKGVNTARVHLVLGKEGNFRRARQEASASIVINADLDQKSLPISAIRRLVAGAVPGLQAERVTIVSNAGVLLGAGDMEETGSTRLIALERNAAQEMRDNVLRTLTPIFGAANVLVNTTVRLNADKRQISETTFNPDSRVERSVRTVRENQTSQNSAPPVSASVDRNLPDTRNPGSANRQSNEDNAKRDETTNYEISSKSIATQSDGYEIIYASVAVAINAPENLSRSLREFETARKQELEQLVASAAGLKRGREHELRISFVGFERDSISAVSGPGLVDELLVRHAGQILSASFWLLGVIAFVFAIGRPTLAAITRPREAISSNLLPAGASTGPGASPLLMPSPQNCDPDPVKSDENHQQPSFADELDRLVAEDEQRSTRILRSWLKE